MESLLLNLQPSIKVGISFFKTTPIHIFLILAACLFSYDTNTQGNKQGHMQNKPPSCCVDELLCSRTALQALLRPPQHFLPAVSISQADQISFHLRQKHLCFDWAKQSSNLFSITPKDFKKDINHYHYSNSYSSMVYEMVYAYNFSTCDYALVFISSEVIQRFWKLRSLNNGSMSELNG